MSRGSEPSTSTPKSAAIFCAPPWPKMCSAWPHRLQTWIAMFSTRPTIGTPTFSNILKPLRASISAMSCGVVTITAPVTGTCCDSVSATSPVPGGMSTIR